MPNIPSTVVNAAPRSDPPLSSLSRCLLTLFLLLFSSCRITDVNVLDLKDIVQYLTVPDAASSFVRPDELIVAPQAAGEAEKDTQKTNKKRKKAESKVDAGLDLAAEKPVLMDVDTDVLQHILAQEIVLRDYNSVLNVAGRPSKVAKTSKEAKATAGMVGKGKYSSVFQLLDKTIREDAAAKARQEKAARQEQLRGSKIANPSKREEAWMLNRQREIDKAGQGSKEGEVHNPIIPSPLTQPPRFGIGGDFDAESFERQMMNNEHGTLMGSKKEKKKDRKAREATAPLDEKPQHPHTEA